MQRYIAGDTTQTPLQESEFHCFEDSINQSKQDIVW
jgi:hypothetical protein